MLSRRSLLKSATAFTGSALLARSTAALASLQPEPPLRQLAYNAVQLLPGPLQDQFSYHHRLLLDLNNDKLLKPFRERTGLPAPGDDMGGWYSNSPFFDPHGAFEGFVPGHSFGQYLSALSRAGAITQNRATLTKVEELVRGLSPTLSERFYNGYSLPAYTFDKTCCGLLDAYSHAGVASARPALQQALTAVLPHLPEKALSRPEQHARPYTNEAQTWDETYTLPENLFLAYHATGITAFRDVAARFLEDDLYFNPLSEDINVLPGEHAYSHVNAFSSAMQAYLTLGSQKHLRAAANGFRMVRAQSFATGGWGPGETLLRPDTDDLGRSVFTQPASFETPCGAYAHFKITRYLLRVTGDSRFGDSMERVLYNTVLGAKPILPDGSSFYYSDFTLTGRKAYSRDKWPCCSGTLPQIAADYGISTYLLGTPRAESPSAGTGETSGISVILFVPSRVTFDHAGSPVTLTQETAYPAQLSSSLQFTLARDAAFPIAIRIPAWAGPGTRVLVNGKGETGDVSPGTFHTLRRTWRSGDRIEITFDAPLRTESLTVTSMARTRIASPASAAATPPASLPLTPKEPIRLAALLRGPVVFMATGAWPTEVNEHDLLNAAVASSGEEVVVSAQTTTTKFKPYTRIGDETYRTYQPLRST